MLDKIRKWLYNGPSINKERMTTMSAYNDASVAKLRAAAPLNLEKAHALSAELGVSYRSIISKAKSLGIEYVKASAPARKRTGPSKADICSAIEQAMGLELPGLDKAPAATLGLILAEVVNDDR